MEEADKIKVLLAEYSNLTCQLTSRFSGQCQTYAMSTTIGVALVGACLAGAVSIYSMFLLFALAAVPLTWLWFDIDRDIAKAAKRLREIEERVNLSAGEELLVWETSWGRGGTKRIVQKATERLLHPS